jgi:diacylglycerol kinase (ATP)
MRRRALVIVNAKSRSGKAALGRAVQGLEQAGIDPIHRDCADRDALSPTIIEDGQDVNLIVVGGGDGTLNAAAQGVMNVKRPLGILPCGTANDLARTLGIPTDLESAIAVIAAGHVRTIDVGTVNDVPFFNVASIGLSAEMALELTRDIKRRFGKLGYAVAAMKVLARAQPFRVQIASSDTRARALTLQVAVGNGRFYGGGSIVEKTARIDDARLHLYSLEFLRAWKLVLMLRSFRAGEHGAWSEVRTLEDQTFDISTRRPRPVNADGEIVTHTPARFRVLPRAIDVLVPAEER